MKQGAASERFKRWRELFLSAWRVREDVLHTYLRPDDCAARLKSGVDSTWRWRGPHPVVGSVRPRSFSLRMREGRGDAAKSFVYVAGFHTVVRGRLHESGSGTRITLKSSTSLGERIFMAYAFGFIALWWGAAIYGVLTKDDPVIKFLVLVPILFVIALAAQTIYGRWQAREEHDELMTFLSDRLDARRR